MLNIKCNIRTVSQLLLVFILIISTTLPGFASAEDIQKNIQALEKVIIPETDEVIASGTYGTSEWRIDSEGILHIGEGTFMDTNDVSPWKGEASQIVKIVFEGPVEAAADSSSLFSSLFNVQTFEGIEYLDTSNVTNMKNMFSDMSSLTQIDLSNFDTSNVTMLGNMFSRSSSISKLDLSSFNTSKVVGTNGMFNDMRSLTVLNLSSFDMANVQNTKSMFWDTPNLSQITLGPLFKFGLEGPLPTIRSFGKYTGKWINISTGSKEKPSGKNIWTSAELSKSFNGETDADTYVWQQLGTLNVHDSVLYIGDMWSAEDNFNSALDLGGNIVAIDFKDVKVTGEVDTSNAGSYEVTYNYEGIESKATVIVKEKQNIPGADVTVKYKDESGSLIADDEILKGNIDDEYVSEQKDIDGYTFKEVKENNAKGIFTDQSQIVTYIYSKNRGASDDLVHIAVHDSALKVGDKWSPEDNFDEATDFEGRLKDFSDIIVEGSVDTTKAGTYEVTYIIPEEYWGRTVVEGHHSAKAKIVVTNADESNQDFDNDAVKITNNINLSTDKSESFSQNLPETGEGNAFSLFTMILGITSLMIGAILSIVWLKKKDLN